MRQIVLDTETTGLSPKDGHRIIEIGCVELIDREITGNRYHQYIHPQRDIDPGAERVHGISLAFLDGKPTFDAIADDFVAFIDGAELVIHNAPFDVGFLEAELARVAHPQADIGGLYDIIDTLTLARKKHPGQKNNLDALCKRYQVDNADRTLHGALLDAEILADVYLAMTGGQAKMHFGEEHARAAQQAWMTDALRQQAKDLPELVPSQDEQSAHQKYCDSLSKEKGEPCYFVPPNDDASQ